jgi:hypothetical protein
MTNDTEKRLQALERHYLSLEASSIFTTQAIGVLLALIEACANAAKLQSHPPIRELYTKLLRENTETFLRTAADDSPALASRIREILARELDRENGTP